jgi:hypothetical protein
MSTAKIKRDLQAAGLDALRRWGGDEFSRVEELVRP